MAPLHKENIVHRDIKPQNIFLRDDGQLLLGDLGIVFLPDQSKRLTVTNESVGPHEYMPQWAALAERLETVEPNFDVYMLGKVLWCMVSGRPKLPREYHRRPGFNLAELFPRNPDMHLINSILDKCLVEEPDKCLSSAQHLLVLVDAALQIMEHGGQLLDDL